MKPSIPRAWLAVGVMGVAAVGLAGCTEPTEAPRTRGVVVTKVVAGGAASRAGLAPGDRLVAWRRVVKTGAEAGGPVTSPIDLRRVEDVEASVSEISLRGWRGETALEVTMPPALWRLEARPDWAADHLVDYLEGRRRIDTGEIESGVDLWRALAERLTTAGQLHDAVWLLDAASSTLQTAGREEAAIVLHQAAVEITGEDPVAGPWLWQRHGERLRPAAAGAAYRRARESYAVPAALEAWLLYQQCVAAYRQNASDEAERLCGQSNTLWGRLAPGRVGQINATVLLAKVARNRGQLEDAIGQLEAVQAVAVALDPGGRLVAKVSSELGIVEQNRGDLAAAQQLQSQALAIYEQLGVRDEQLGQAFMALGVVAWNRGALVEAHRAIQRAQEVFESVVPGSNFEAWSLQGLGLVALDRGDYGTAAGFLRRCLAIHEDRLNTLDAAQALSNLGAVAEARGDLEEAVEAYESALRLYEERLPESLGAARILGDLGDLRAKSGLIEAARKLQDRALAWFDERAPGSVGHAFQLFQRGQLELEQGRLAAAEPFLQQALAIRRRLAPGSAQEAVTLHALGKLRSDQGRPREALDFVRRALLALEAQKSQLGGANHDAASFAARFGPMYKDLVRLLLESGETVEAFEVLERYRAQGLLAMLGVRDLLLDAEVPAELAERRLQLSRAYEQGQKELERLGGLADNEQVESLVARLQTLRQRRERVAAELVEASPRYGRLVSPRPLGAAEAAGVLDDGTLLLSYVVLPDETFLFALEAGDAESLEAVPLGIGEDELRREVQAFLYLIRSPGATSARSGLRRRGQELYRRLLAPLESRIESAERLLIVPDGPLHALSFAALRGDGVGQQADYLVTRKALHTTVSVTAYGQLERPEASAAEAGGQLVAFGDPRYAASVETPAASAGLRARALVPLPATRAEVTAVASLFPETVAYLGDAATEGRAKTLSGGAKYLHFACHSAVDHRFPLDSYLALSLPVPGANPEDENGFLQAWEIFEQVRLEAELVTLSACETGLGQEVGGDGLVGLTRAFQYAGARSVLASLWGVSDRSTSALMVRFYGYLRAGQTKDQALRSAQLDLLRGPVAVPGERASWWVKSYLFILSLFAMVESPDEWVDATHPFYWAAFQLHGDWR